MHTDASTGPACQTRAERGESVAATRVPSGGDALGAADFEELGGDRAPLRAPAAHAHVERAVGQPGVGGRLLSGRVGGLRSSRGGGIKGGDVR